MIGHGFNIQSGQESKGSIDFSFKALQTDISL